MLRRKLVSQWTLLPDFASVNFKEEGAVELADLLLSRGVAIEVGLSDNHGAEVLVSSGLAPRCLRICWSRRSQRQPPRSKTSAPSKPYWTVAA